MLAERRCGRLEADYVARPLAVGVTYARIDVSNARKLPAE